MNDNSNLPEGLEVVPLEMALQEVAAIEHKKNKNKPPSSKSQPQSGAVVVNIPRQEARNSKNKNDNNNNHDPATLEIGSDLEVAKCVQQDLEERFGRILFAEGAFWRFAGSDWQRIHEDELRLSVHLYDGALFYTPEGGRACVRLGKARIGSTLHTLTTLCADREFFNEQQVGVNCASGFIRFDAAGKPTLEPHSPDHRCRHTLPGRWHPGASGRPADDSLLARLLGGAFRDDDDADQKMALLSEVCGAAALGYATRLMNPRAVILYGQTAENGKSQILDLVRGLLPASAICCVPAAAMSDERHIIGLAGKLLNASDELSSAAVASEAFKAVVTGEPVHGRNVYASRVEFRAVAQNLFATNNLPHFRGGMDRGVQRRLLVVPFNRRIPEAERVEGIGRRITVEEADLLLGWAVDGASRLIRQRNFAIPQSCKQALEEWLFEADPVLAWVNEEVSVQPINDLGHPRITTRTAYERFRTWAINEGYKNETLPAIRSFTCRIQANVAGIRYHRDAHGRWFLGMDVPLRL